MADLYSRDKLTPEHISVLRRMKDKQAPNMPEEEFNARLNAWDQMSFEERQKQFEMMNKVLSSNVSSDNKYVQKFDNNVSSQDNITRLPDVAIVSGDRKKDVTSGTTFAGGQSYNGLMAGYAGQGYDPFGILAPERVKPFSITDMVGSGETAVFSDAAKNVSENQNVSNGLLSFTESNGSQRDGQSDSVAKGVLGDITKSFETVANKIADRRFSDYVPERKAVQYTGPEAGYTRVPIEERRVDPYMTINPSGIISEAPKTMTMQQLENYKQAQLARPNAHPVFGSDVYRKSELMGLGSSSPYTDGRPGARYYDRRDGGAVSPVRTTGIDISADIPKSMAPIEDKSIEKEISDDLKTIIKPDAQVDYSRLARALAIGFNTLRTFPDQQLQQGMFAQIDKDRELRLARSGASSIEAIGGEKARVIADALRRGAITYDQALTAVYKNESQVKEMLKLMESDPEGFAKIAPYLSGQGYGEMQGVLLKAALKLQEDSRTKAQASADAFSSVERLENILNEFQQSGYSTGEWAETKKNLLSTLAQYGIQINREFLDQATTLEGASNLLVADELRKNKGPQTDFDALFTSRFVPSLLGRPEANQERIRYLKSKSLVDMMIDEAVQKVELGASNPSQIQGQISKIMALATNRNMAKVIKISDAKDGVLARFTSFAEFVDAYRAEEPEAEAVDILNEWMDVVAKARKTFKTGAL